MKEFFNSLLFMLNEMSPYILLGFLVAGILQAFVRPAMMTRHLAGTGWKSVLKAAAFGVPLPLCSCGVLPAAVALRRGGASRAASSSFLIATPQTGVDSIAATYAMLGPAFAVVRPVAALTTALAGGCLVGRDEAKNAESKADCAGSCPAPAASEEPKLSFWRKLAMALRYGFFDMVQSIGGWLVIGLVIAAVITVAVPDNFFVQFKDYTLITMLAVVIVAVPMYVCATGSIPIAMSLMLKGLSPGTALVMLMAGPAANFASITVIAREMGRRAAAIYLGSIVAGAILFGLLIDMVLPASWFTLAGGAHACGHGEAFSWFSTVCSAILVILLIIAIVSGKLHKHSHNITTDTMEYKIKGMNCQHCRASVEKGIAALEGVKSVTVDLASGIASVEGTATREEIAACVRSLGFDMED